MSKDQKAPVAHRIDLSNCKLLSPYGQNIADKLRIDAKIGITKTGLTKFGITKIGLVKIGVVNKPGTIR